MGVSQFVNGHSRLDRDILKAAMTLLFREKFPPVCNQEPEIARASLVNPRKINLVQNPMAQREPHPAVQVQSRAHTGFRA